MAYKRHIQYMEPLITNPQVHLELMFVHKTIVCVIIVIIVVLEYFVVYSNFVIYVRIKHDGMESLLVTPAATNCVCIAFSDIKFCTGTRLAAYNYLTHA